MKPLKILSKIPIRTIGLHQPFACLMLHGKIETRWVREGRTPAFPSGAYLIYATKHVCTREELLKWGADPDAIEKLLEQDPAKNLRGQAIGVGVLRRWELLTAGHPNTFVKFVGQKTEWNEDAEAIVKVQWGGIFENVQRILPFAIKGHQGVGIFPENQHHKIQHHG